jgi:outer membrane protein OmpA-like peptidoglycan-associated protein
MKKLLVTISFFISLIASAQEQVAVYFDSNKHELKKAEQDRLNTWISQNQTSKILAINGYTDEDGSVGLNDTLAQRRVSHVFNIVKGKVEAREDFKTRSFGKLHKHSPVKAENRKVVIYYLPEKELHRENDILGINPEPKPVVKYPSKIVVTTPAGKEEINLDVEFMKKVGDAKAGEKLILHNINFFENTFATTPDSRPKMYELLEIMKLHPKMKIKLQGHICCQKGDPRKLSYERAKAIMRFLTLNGIEKARVTFEGLGTTQPIHTLPEKNEEERAANRRVEILVVEN